MSRVCQVTGKKPSTGYSVSHSHVRTKRWWVPNVHKRRFWLPSEKRWVLHRYGTYSLGRALAYGANVARKGFTVDQTFVEVRRVGRRLVGAGSLLLRLAGGFGLGLHLLRGLLHLLL